jgi:hypothetical protein
MNGGAGVRSLGNGESKRDLTLAERHCPRSPPKSRIRKLRITWNCTSHLFTITGRCSRARDLRFRMGGNEENKHNG